MRILHVVTRSEFGGAQSIARVLAEAQAVSGHTVGIVAGLEGSWEAFSGLDPRIESIKLPQLMRAIRPKEDIKAIKSLSAVYKRWKPDIVHLHTSKAGALGRIASGMAKQRIVYTMHGYDQIRVLNSKMLIFDKLLSKICGAVVAVSCRDAEAMERDGYTVEVIPNGVPEPISQESEQSETIDRLKADGLPLVITAARDAPPKRIDICRNVAACLQGKAHFVWVGGNPKPEDPPNFHALGVIPEASALFTKADIFLLCSDNEGMPLSLLEAMACGLPVVASAVGGISEVLMPDTNGVSAAGFVLPNDESVFSLALEKLVNNPVLRQKAGEAARTVWKTRYASDIMTKEYFKLYTKLYSKKDKHS